jgi:hypothetical protein
VILAGLTALGPGGGKLASKQSALVGAREISTLRPCALTLGPVGVSTVAQRDWLQPARFLPARALVADIVTGR